MSAHHKARPQATLRQLQQRWGHLERYQGATSEYLVLIAMGGYRETWHWVSGHGRMALYELESVE